MDAGALGAPALPTDAQLVELLREHFGLSGPFRPGQLEAIRATLSGQDTLVILPTGGKSLCGKSICFQLPPFCRSSGFTVVVCPLIALAKDQVAKCEERGIEAERWNCEVSEAKKASIVRDIVSDEPSLRLLYTTPESLRLPVLLDALKEAHAQGKLVSFAVDEAHTVSEWGHDFRPAYLELAAIKLHFPTVPVAALTASCTPRVSQDIINVLRLNLPLRIQGSFNRHNIAYQVYHKELIGDGSENAALEHLIQFINDRPGQCGIIYARLRATCDWLASSLAGRDVEVGCYHAGRATDARGRVQREWSEGGLNVVVATVAFGMGIDRADVRWVVHWNAPASMEGFYQESGRAGRDGQPSLSLMYASGPDLESAAKMERGSRAGAVAEVVGFARGGGCKRKHVLKFFGEAKGACDASREQLCDFCADPKAVQRALSRLEQRQAEHGSRAQMVRARMLGIRVAADGDDAEEAEAGASGKAGDGDDDGAVGGSGSAPKIRGLGAWSSANAYATNAPSSAAGACTGAGARAGAGGGMGGSGGGGGGGGMLLSAGAGPSGSNAGDAAAGSSAAVAAAVASAAVGRLLALRRPPAVKRPLAQPSASDTTILRGDPAAAASTAGEADSGPGETIEEAVAVEAEAPTEPSTGSSAPAAPPPPQVPRPGGLGAPFRQPRLKRPKPTAPQPPGLQPAGSGGDTSSAVGVRPPVTDGAVPSEAGKPAAAGAEAGLQEEAAAGGGGGAALAAEARPSLGRKQFKPPAWIGKK
ncbi:hypothetical protein HYH03_006881 [Edaphochlamys debaryana]|uniref:DNA 3'-5' helicase n=1 Tax=Edaphochlamys debaryana TaxID=47281 RepID=A0A835Y688_9CHLO|nr:hypothetical protein HYH03_006881 [Edaphochlamys debaryana]|eukprot:KAG2494946.1 hypothetical protein HYH03_006881 [Edaphochlamys debaryana]